MEKRTLQRTKSREMSSSSPSSSPNAGAARPFGSLHRRSPLSDAAVLKRSSPALVVLWPSANKPLSLADHLTNDRLSDPTDPKNIGSRRSAALIASPQAQSVARQRSYSEHPALLKQGGEEGEDKKNKKRTKQHQLRGGSPTIGGSMRHIGEVIRLPPPSNPGSSPAPSVFSSRSLVLRRGARADLALDFASSDSDRSDTNISSQKPINFPNREEQLRRPTRSSSSPISWRLSSGRRSGASSAVETEARAAKGRINNSFISLGLDLFRRRWKESSPPSSPPLCSVSGGVKKRRAADDEVRHQLRVMQSHLIQWRWVNARAERVDAIKAALAEVTVSSGWVGLSNLQARVVRKKVQLEKEKLHLKLNALLSSQLRALEEWSEVAQKHNSATSTTKNCLQALVCKLPLVDGAKVDVQLLLSSVWYAKDLSLASEAAISGITRMHADERMTLSELLVELRKLVNNERALLQECFHLLSCMFPLHIQERSLRCHLMQLHLYKYK